MTATLLAHRHSRTVQARCAWAVTALLTVPAVVAGCAEQAPAGDAGAEGSTSDGPVADEPTAAVGAAASLVVDPVCPQALKARDLGHRVDYGSADVDGDGELDAISIGTVTDGRPECAAALVVTTASGTAATALPGLQIVPPRAFVPGGAADVGGESVIAAPVSFSPRGGGEVGLFTLADGVLTPVQNESGEPWTILATVDDGGGLPQSIDCGPGGLTWVQASSDGFGGPEHIKRVTYTLDDAQLSRTGSSGRTGAGYLPAGLSIFASC